MGNFNTDLYDDLEMNVEESRAFLAEISSHIKRLESILKRGALISEVFFQVERDLQVGWSTDKQRLIAVVDGKLERPLIEMPLRYRLASFRRWGEILRFFSTEIQKKNSEES